MVGLLVVAEVNNKEYVCELKYVNGTPVIIGKFPKKYKFIAVFQSKDSDQFGMFKYDKNNQYVLAHSSEAIQYAKNNKTVEITKVFLLREYNPVSN